jgi:hypothetical protein
VRHGDRQRQQWSYMEPSQVQVFWLEAPCPANPPARDSIRIRESRRHHQLQSCRSYMLIQDGDLKKMRCHFVPSQNFLKAGSVRPEQLISHQPTVLFSQNKSVTSNQSAVLFSQNKPAPAISHQPNEQVASLCLF